MSSRQRATKRNDHFNGNTHKDIDSGKRAKAKKSVKNFDKFQQRDKIAHLLLHSEEAVMD